MLLMQLRGEVQEARGRYRNIFLLTNVQNNIIKALSLYILLIIFTYP